MHDVKTNGLKMNGYCVSAKGNGIITNGHVMNGHSLLVNGNGLMVKNGYEKNGQWKMVEDDMRMNRIRENGYCGLVKRHKKDRDASKGRSTVSEETSSTEDEPHSEETTSEREVPHVSETAQSSHIKVRFHVFLNIP